MKCIIIDDAPLAIDIIESYLEKIEGIEIVAKCTNPLDALNVLSNQTIDLVFLDIQMPNLTGLELVKSLENPPQFILTTAYPQYALEGFELNATDYLVKPIPLGRFIKAVSRARELHKLKMSGKVSEAKQVKKYIFVKSEYDNVKIRVDTIKYIEALGAYISINTNQSEKSILTLMSFNEILEKLSNPNFLRVHRSFIVNIEQIDSVQKTKVLIDNQRIPIGETYKKELMNKLDL